MAVRQTISAWRKTSGAMAANDFAGQCRVDDLMIDSGHKVYICTATNGSTTATWQLLGSQT